MNAQQKKKLAADIASNFASIEAVGSTALRDVLALANAANVPDRQADILARCFALANDAALASNAINHALFLDESESIITFNAAEKLALLRGVSLLSSIQCLPALVLEASSWNADHDNAGA